MKFSSLSMASPIAGLQQLNFTRDMYTPGVNKSTRPSSIIATVSSNARFKMSWLCGIFECDLCEVRFVSLLNVRSEPGAFGRPTEMRLLCVARTLSLIDHSAAMNPSLPYWHFTLGPTKKARLFANWHDNFTKALGSRANPFREELSCSTTRLESSLPSS